MSLHRALRTLLPTAENQSTSTFFKREAQDNADKVKITKFAGHFDRGLSMKRSLSKLSGNNRHIQTPT